MGWVERKAGMQEYRPRKFQIEQRLEAPYMRSAVKYLYSLPQRQCLNLMDFESCQHADSQLQDNNAVS